MLDLGNHARDFGFYSECDGSHCLETGGFSLLLWLTFQMEPVGSAADQPWPWRTLTVNWRVLALFIGIFLGIFETDRFIQGHDHNVVCIKSHQCKWWYISQSFFLVLWVLFHRWKMVKHFCSDSFLVFTMTENILCIDHQIQRNSQVWHLRPTVCGHTQQDSPSFHRVP